MHDDIYETLILRQATGERLSQQEAHQLQAHLETCADCRALVEEWAQIAQAAQRRAHKHAATLPPLPALAPQRVRANGVIPDDMENEPMTTIPMTQAYQRRHIGGRLGFLAAAVLVGLIALMLVWMNTDDEPPALFATSIAQEPTATPLPERAWVGIAREDIAAEAQLNLDNVDVRYTLVDEIDPDALTSTVSRAVINTRVIGNTATQPIADGTFIQPGMVGEAFNVMGQRQQEILVDQRPQTAYDVLMFDERLSDFRRLVDAHAPTRELLRSQQPVWVYAPTNEALSYDDLPALIDDDLRLKYMLDGYVMRPRDVLYANFGSGATLIGAYPVANGSMVQVVECGPRASGFCGSVQRMVEQPLADVLDDARDIATPDGTVALPLWEDNIDYEASADSLRIGQTVRLYEDRQIHADNVMIMDVNLGSELSPLPSMLLAVDEAVYPALSRLVTDGVTFHLTPHDTLSFPVGLVAVTLPADVRTDSPLTGETIISIDAGETRIVEDAQFVSRFGSGNPERVSGFITLAMSPQDAQNVFDYIENGVQLQVEAVDNSIEGQLSSTARRVLVDVPLDRLVPDEGYIITFTGGVRQIDIGAPVNEPVLAMGMVDLFHNEDDEPTVTLLTLPDMARTLTDALATDATLAYDTSRTVDSNMATTILYDPLLAAGVDETTETVDVYRCDDDCNTGDRALMLEKTQILWLAEGYAFVLGTPEWSALDGRILIEATAFDTLQGDGFSFAYPAGWAVEENTTNEDIIYLAILADSQRLLDATGGTELTLEPGQRLVRFSLSDADFLSPGLDDDETVTGVLNALQATVTRGADTEVLEVVDSGDRGELILGTNGNVFIYHIIEVEDGVFATFLGAANAQGRDELRSLLDTMATSLDYVPHVDELSNGVEVLLPVEAIAGDVTVDIGDSVMVMLSNEAACESIDPGIFPHCREDAADMAIITLIGSFDEPVIVQHIDDAGVRLLASPGVAAGIVSAIESGEQLRLLKRGESPVFVQP